MTESDRDQVLPCTRSLKAKLAPIFRELLRGAGARKAIGWHRWATTTRRWIASTLPVQPVTWGEIPGRSGSLIIQQP